jgi:integrase
MRRLMGVIKDRHGTYYAQQRVPEPLQAAVARVLNDDKSRRVFLKKSLGTKNLKEANAAAVHVLADFNRIIAEAEAMLKERPLVTTLTDAQIKRMAESFYASVLAKDEEERREGTGMEELFESIAEAAGINYSPEPGPEAGLSDREVVMRAARLDRQLGGTANVEATRIDTSGWPEIEIEVPATPGLLAALKQIPPTAQERQRTLPEALARGDITVIKHEMDNQLGRFQLNVDRKSPSYRKLGTAMLSAYVRALRNIERRNAGEPVDTPQVHLLLPSVTEEHEGGSLRKALEGWKKERARPEGTILEYTRAVEMFIQLHGNLAIADIKKRQALEFREALQLVPRTRRGALLRAGLPELSQWGREHPSAPKVSAGTVNKQLGAVQAIASWGYQHGLVPDDIAWADPFRDMRLEEEQSQRGSFDATELQSVFDAPIFTGAKMPVGGKGPAGFWLPVLALFTGARQGEIAGLQVKNVREVEGVTLIYIVADRAAGKRLKAKTSERVVPVHPELARLGFLGYVAERARDGQDAWLFPLVAPSERRGVSAWSKWFGHYLRNHICISNPDRVFHSFRHSFQDALRRATPDAELRDALPGRSSGEKSVSRGYGAKYMIDRWGLTTLKETIDAISYPGLDLSRVKSPVVPTRTRGRRRA